MKLDYATLISPYPFYLERIGGIKSPTLKAIWNPDITYQTYQMYITLLLMTPENYCKQADISMQNWYQSLSEEEQQHLNMMDFIANNKNLQSSYTKMFNFFFVENVFWDNKNQVFFLTQDNVFYDETNQFFYLHNNKKEKTPTDNFGLIHRNIFVDLCDIILQRCGIIRSDTDTDTSKVKNKRALEILKKLKKGRENISKTSNNDKDINLPNLIASVAVKSNSINFTNIWDLTVFQLYEQFKKEQTNVYFDIKKMSVAAYGNEKNTFQGNEWYKN